LERVRVGEATAAEMTVFDRTKQHLGYALLLKRYAPNVVYASEEQIKRAAADTVPNVPVLFWTFRFMVAIGFFLIFLFAAAFYFSAKHVIGDKRWFLRLALLSLPLPWLAAELGWIVAEYGRQPWAIADVLPTRLATSTLQLADLRTSMIGFVVFYTALAIVEVYLMVKYGRLGPSSLHTGRYYFEKAGGATEAMRTLGTREL
jgi:cytochrome d ubiquinol oxidase subunit I